MLDVDGREHIWWRIGQFYLSGSFDGSATNFDDWDEFPGFEQPKKPNNPIINPMVESVTFIVRVVMHGVAWIRRRCRPWRDSSLHRAHPPNELGGYFRSSLTGLREFEGCVGRGIISRMARFMAEEIFDVVNERDEVIGQAPRKEVHARGWWHRAIHVLVFNARGEVFLQKRSRLKDTAKGKWDSSSSGHVDTGETYDACAVRELREEIGLDLPQPPNRLFKVDARPETGWEFCWVFRCRSEGPFTLHPDEIETGAWFAPEFVTQWIAGKPDDFASAFVFIWKKFQTLDKPV